MVRFCAVTSVVAALLGCAGAAAAQSTSASKAQGFSVGADMLSMNNQLAAGAQLGVPISRVVSVVLRPMLLGGESSSDLDAGGRVEVRFESSVSDRLRAYFGAGPQGFYQIRGSHLHDKDFSGGWDVGLEYFLNDRYALHWEMGTSGGGVAAGAGPVFTVGVRTYSNWLSPRRG